MTETWFCIFWCVYFNLLSFLSAIAEFLQNHFFSISNQKLRLNHNFIFSMLLRKSVYHMTAVFHKYKKIFDFIVFFSDADDVFDLLNENKNILNSKFVVWNNILILNIQFWIKIFNFFQFELLVEFSTKFCWNDKEFCF